MKREKDIKMKHLDYYSKGTKKFLFPLERQDLYKKGLRLAILKKFADKAFIETLSKIQNGDKIFDGICNNVEIVRVDEINTAIKIQELIGEDYTFKSVDELTQEFEDYKESVLLDESDEYVYSVEIKVAS